MPKPRRLLAVLSFALVLPALAQDAADTPRSVRTLAQPRPGAEPAEHDMPVHTVPVDPPLVAADEAGLPDEALVLGVEHGGEAVAFPIQSLANFEVLNSRVGGLPVAPTW